MKKHLKCLGFKPYRKNDMFTLQGFTERYFRCEKFCWHYASRTRFPFSKSMCDNDMLISIITELCKYNPKEIVESGELMNFKINLAFPKSQRVFLESIPIRYFRVDESLQSWRRNFIIAKYNNVQRAKSNMVHELLNDATLNPINSGKTSQIKNVIKYIQLSGKYFQQ